MVKGDSKFVYRDALWHGADLVGTGIASFSHVNGVHYQNIDTYEKYIEMLSQDEIPLGRALPVSSDQSLIREMILQLKTGRLDTGYYKQKFDTDILEVFGEVFSKYEDDALLTRSNGDIHLTRKGLLQVDGMLPEFFETQHQNARYT